MEPATYVRLPGRHAGWLSRDSLWAADDHLLVVQSTGITERYRRYFFVDIQGFTVRPTPRSRRVALGTGLPLLLAVGLIVLTAGYFGEVGWAVAIGILGLPLVATFAVNVLKGASCATTLHTAVGDARLNPLSREHATFRALQLIAARVEAAQGPLDPAALGYSDEPGGAPAAMRRRAASIPPRHPEDPGDGAAGQAPVAPAARAQLLVLGGSELLLALAAGILVFLGVGAIRETAACVALAIVFVASTVALARGNKIARRLGALALGHATLIGLCLVIALHVAAVQVALVQAAGSSVPQSEHFIDPAVPAVAALLWFVTVSALGIALGCVMASRAGGRPK